MLQIHTKLSEITKRLAKLPKTPQPTTFLEFYNLLPHCDREQFKEDMKIILDLTEGQWRNRQYGRTKFTAAEVLVLGMVSKQEHKL
jgi:hypothetical protein